jgi:hypothetical protein
VDVREMFSMLLLLGAAISEEEGFFSEYSNGQAKGHAETSASSTSWTVAAVASVDREQCLAAITLSEA